MMRMKLSMFFLMVVCIFFSGLYFASASDFSISNVSGTKHEILNKGRNFVVKAAAFGATGNGTDQTQALQSALNYLERAGGGKLVLGKGKFLLSLAKSVHDKACLIIPAGVTIEGSGVGVTILKRISSEREQNGILLVNKGYDTNGEYKAAGNITLRNFTITDGGVTSKPRKYGDLIALGHADNVLIERVQSLNHDQHFVDICGSRNVTVRESIGNNLQDTYGTATIQIDRAKNLGIWGLLLDGTNPKNVTIENNEITSMSELVLQLGHDQSTVENLNVVSNVITGANTVKGQIAIGKDEDTSISTANIKDNQIKLNNANSVGINLVTDTANRLDNISISGNVITGKMRTATFIDSAVASTDFKDILYSLLIDLSSGMKVLY
ncbi:hypothetical protein MMB75_25605 [Paenibacillus sp. P2(2022)]|uniref:hypothetical protein n=1 Tax=Paenibacillus TaxID=44249 RepID=UPI00096CE643|nr:MULTISPECIES: hypothetical protein [Paenibacillus]MDG0057006.1 hypothetical protein [Paenibacillus sp. P2(2022)]OMF50891.1 hypothetical protein BK135_01110 [Paenibacillus peoriae]